jgi:hypothetical protein
MRSSVSKIRWRSAVRDGFCASWLATLLRSLANRESFRSCAQRLFELPQLLLQAGKRLFERRDLLAHCR